MQIIIEHSATTRKIAGGFKMYGTKADFAELVKQIQAQANGAFDTGWITITPTPEAQEKTVVKWDM